MFSVKGDPAITSDNPSKVTIQTSGIFNKSVQCRSQLKFDLGYVFVSEGQILILVLSNKMREATVTPQSFVFVHDFAMRLA